jgi:AcrR family transcriptional regulator
MSAVDDEERGQEVPLPPWLARRPERRPRTPLSRDAIVDAALRVLERDGPDGLSMRRVANELGTGAASLYWHVSSKDELADLIIDRVTREIEVPEPDPAHWQEQLTEWMIKAREVLKRHPGVGALTLGRIPIGPNTVQWIEWFVGLLRSAGVPDRIATYAGDLGGLYLGAHALEDAIGLRSPTGEDLAPEEIIGMFRGYLESLPPDRFPNLHATMDHMFAGDEDERFRLGIELILRGIASYIPEEG